MSTAPPTDSAEMVLVSKEVLKELERLRKLEEELPAVIELAKSEANAERFAALRARDAADPTGHAKRSAEWKRKHKEEYNAKRREQYRLKKEASADKSPGV